jgi:hypothetical protein
MVEKDRGIKRARIVKGDEIPLRKKKRCSRNNDRRYAKIDYRINLLVGDGEELKRLQEK